MVIKSNQIQTQAPQGSTLLRQAWHFNRLLTVSTVFHAVLILVGIIGMALDTRIILNAPIWAKTTKFAISITLYSVTLLWMLTYMKSRPRLAQFIASNSGAIMLIEIAVILVQNILRSVPSHYNVATPFDGVMWSIMGTSIVAVWVINFIAGVVLLFEKMPNPVLGWGIRLGLLIALVGMALAFTMTSPNTTQMAALQSGQKLALIGAHNVNALVDGQNRMIPFLGWNMDGGDLRIAHFIGLHAMQVLPILALFLLGRMPKLSQSRNLALVWVGGLSYLGLTLLALWQALRNQSIVAPDALTLAALGGLTAIAIVATIVIVRPNPVYC